MRDDGEILLIEADEADRLDKVLSRALPDFSRTKLAALCEDGHVLVNGEPRPPRYQVRPGMSISIADLPDPEPFNLEPVPMDLVIRFEDEHLLVVEKPRGLPTHPASSYTGATLVHGLLAHSQLSTGSAHYRPGIVHRLDKDTTGLLVVAKTDFAHAKLAEQISTRAAGRKYCALAYGTTEQQRFRVEAPIARDPRSRLRMCCHPSGRFAATKFSRVSESHGGSLLICQLETGRTHQIRVHLQAVGHPVRGDEQYAKGDWSEGPMQLHAASLSFTHPVSGEAMAIYSPPPADFLAHELIRPEHFDGNL
ncbi:MAG: RluA family pseudouridine synthase [Chthonomonas sp.]|nr:RluA family pseudouridine synthase [Chthonomonas sp.]